jgi:methyl-accepting chemotaxis protein
VSGVPLKLKMKHGIGARILAILALMGVSYLLLLAMVEFTAEATHRHMDRVSAVLFPATLQLQLAEASFEQLKKRDKEAVLLEEPAALADAGKDADAVASALGNLSVTLAGSPDLAARANDLSTQFSSIRSRSDETYTALLASKINVADDLQTKVAALAMDNNRLTATMQDLDGALAGQGREEFEATDVWSSRSHTTGWALLALGLTGFTAIWWTLQFKVIQPLARLGSRMRDIAQGDGDLTGRVEVHGHSELDEVGRWFNVFIERVEQIVLRVTQSAHAVGEAAIGLAGIAHQIASQSATQHEQAMDITASMGEISVAVHQISETTNDAARDARTAEDNAHAGGATVRATVATIQQLLVANQATATKIGELGRASDAIGKITGVIDDIANQTNLLALNASIEAARAGEHGRGFAVVAAEVRRLAERTSLATREIDRTVHAIQAGTAEVVEAMRSSMRHVESGVGSAQSAGDALESIIHGSEAMQRMVTQIATASTQQSYATQSVNANVNEISRIIECTSSSSTRAVDACERLSSLAEDLNELVASFKVRDELPHADEPTTTRYASALPRNTQRPIAKIIPALGLR